MKSSLSFRQKPLELRSSALCRVSDHCGTLRSDSQSFPPFCWAYDTTIRHFTQANGLYSASRQTCIIINGRPILLALYDPPPFR